MKVILIMDISADGYIATHKDEVPWLQNIDWNFFNQLMKKCGVVVLGRRTQEISGEDFPYKDVLNIVMTNDQTLKRDEDNVIFTNISPKEVLGIAEQRGFESVLLIGGGILNSSFLAENLIDEIYLSVHSVVLGDGLPLFGHSESPLSLKLIEMKQLNDELAQLHYIVVK
jgi:dihydrofolate reductase